MAKPARSLAVTAVDTWRRFQHSDEAPLSLDDFRRELLARTQTPHMLAGVAAHAVLEHAPQGAVIQGHGTGFRDLLEGAAGRETSDTTYLTAYGSQRIEAFGDDYYTVTLDEHGKVTKVDLKWELSDDVELTLPPVREMKLGGMYRTQLGDVWVTGRVDGFDGIEVIDHKFQGHPDAEAIVDTYQWRLYLDVAHADRFRWNLFTMKEPLKGETAWRIAAHQELVQFKYPALHDDCVRLVDEAATAIERYAPEYWKRYDVPTLPI